MAKLHHSRLTSALFLVLMLANSLLIAQLTATAANNDQAETLRQQVAQLAQGCRCEENLTSAQLQQIITRIDTLNDRVNHSEHPHTKLFIIQLKNSRNLCNYLLQLQQQNDQQPALSGTPQD